ncbi:uncharacterized protein Dvir_GJ16102 [Drosophila virilis]|uniref:Uncharacterized protein n=1 Tax=Drosophila virilis TaxID=7244 RepID=B4MGX3_DROVI|nr:uncharacterized protein LOC6636920 [Drosophila virilis]EDW62909.1 uncharacterized protein Dvir_GJ16102 [Drosophila virilis]
MMNLHETLKPKTPKPGDGGGSGGGGSGGGWSGGGSCPRPSPEVIRCMQEWACRQVIRLDLRCLLNLNGNNLLGSLVNVHGVTGGAGGAGAGGAGILNTLLNGK